MPQNRSEHEKGCTVAARDMDLFEFLGSLLGQATGTVLGWLTVLAAYLLFIYLVWGLVWHQILRKAGFRGKVFWKIYGAIVLPLAVLPPLEGHLSSTLYDPILAIGGFLFLGGMYYAALAPWPAKAKSKARSKEETPKT